MKIVRLRLNKKIRDNHDKVIFNDVKNESGVYILFNKDLEVIYVGKSNKSFRIRLLAHCSPNNFTERSSNVPRGEVEYFYFIPLEDEFDRMVSELFLVKLFKPTYNFVKKREKETLKNKSKEKDLTKASDLIQKETGK